MKRTFKHLTWTQRLQLEAYLKTKLSKQEIAVKLGVHISTVYREIKRGAYEHTKTRYDWLGDKYFTTKTQYSAELAFDKYRMNMTSHGAPLKIGNDFEFANYLEKRIGRDRLSPCAVLGEIKHKGLKFNTTICPVTLYSYISKGVFLSLSLADLPGKQKKHRKRRVVAKRISKGTSIEKRPSEINERNTFGHWEMDCVCGPSKSALLVLSERLTRKEIIFPIPNKKTETVIHCLNVLERRFGKRFPAVFKTITVDNGSEFQDFCGMEKSIFGKRKRLSVYYCHPYSSYERGTNERINREIRRKLPKGTDFAKFTAEEIRAVETWFNTYPRKILNWATSEEVFQNELAKINV